MRNKVIFFSVLLLVLISTLAFSQTESITITTYYPAPYGVYQTLRLYPSDTQPPCVSADTDSGTMYYDSGSGELMFCSRDINGNLSWQSSTSLWIRSGNSVYLRNNAWRVGIGTDKVVGMLVMYEHETQGAIHLAGKGDSGTYSGLFLDDDDEDFTNRNTWHITHKKDTGAVSENDFHITRWIKDPVTNNNVGRTDLVIDSATGNIGIGTYDPQAKLDVAGEARIGSTGLGCIAATAGAMKYTSGVVEYCDGTNWRSFGPRVLLNFKDGVGKNVTNRVIDLLPASTTINVSGTGNKNVLFLLSAMFMRTSFRQCGGLTITLYIGGAYATRIMDSSAGPDMIRTTLPYLISLSPGNPTIRLTASTWGSPTAAPPQLLP